jgi:Choline/Carnitine o-acyltransferase
MSNSAKLSPDAFIQMALQLAWNLDQGKPTAIYETASTRLYLHGRTEVIRSLSAESVRWVQAMNDPTELVRDHYIRIRYAHPSSKAPVYGF